MRKVVLSLAACTVFASAVHAAAIKVQLPNKSPEAVALMQALIDAGAVITPGKDGISASGSVRCEDHSVYRMLVLECRYTPAQGAPVVLPLEQALAVSNAVMAGAHAASKTVCSRSSCASYEAKNVSCVESPVSGTRCSFDFSFER